MAEQAVTRLRPRAEPGYTDAAALNDIHALLTTTTTGDVAGDVALILARAGRPMVAVRDIDAAVTETPPGRPVARVESAGTAVTVRQEPAGAGLLIQVTTTEPNGPGGVTVTVDYRRPHDTSPPPGGDAA
jgi:hypothetical protein